MKRKFIPFINRRFVSTIGFPVCGAEELDAVDFDFCDPKIALSEIQRIFLQKVGSAPMVDWTQPEEWTSIISETDTGINAMRVLTVIGDKPAPTGTIKEISNGRRKITRKEHIVNFTVDEMSDLNHTFLQGAENGITLKMRYENAGGYMFGGNNGIIVEITGDMVLARGAGEIMVYNYVARWISTTTEDRIVSPIFGETVLGSESFDTTILFDADATPNHGNSDFVLAGGVDDVARFQYNEITPNIDPTTTIAMTIKVSTVLALTCNMPNDFYMQPFSFTDTAGVVHTGFIQTGDVNF